jgi:hypothetical protein
MRVIYCDIYKTSSMTVSVNEEVCKIIISGDKGLSFLANNVKIESGYI